jgi:hypothetical protein
MLGFVFNSIEYGINGALVREFHKFMIKLKLPEGELTCHMTHWHSKAMPVVINTCTLKATSVFRTAQP